MPMTGEEFQNLVASLEKLARTRPGQYKFRVAALALLSYLYIITILLSASAACVSLIMVCMEAHGSYALVLKLGLPIALLGFFICRSFWIKFAPPVGIPISATDSPKIIELLNELRSKLDCPKIDGVFLNADFNASVYSMPTFGFLGSHKHYLCLGLPLMQSLSPEQFRAVIAHELGHLSGSHGKFGSWIYSVRSTSAQLLDAVRKESALGSFIFKRFFEWYYPYFNAYSFVLIRQHEYEADKRSAEVSGKDAACLSLINCELKNRYVDLKYWKELFKNVDESPDPPKTPFHDLSELMLRASMDRDAYKWYREALRRKTSTTQSHPALADRIQAITLTALPSRAGLRLLNYADLTEDDLRDVWRIEKSAAQEYFQNSLVELEKRMDIAWHHAYDGNWKMLHHERSEAKKRLEVLEKKHDSEKLTNEELLQLAQLSVQLKQAEEAIPILKEAVERVPDDLSLNYNLGERLLSAGDLSGIEILDRVMALQPIFGLELCEIIYQHLMDQGMEEEAQGYLNKSFAYRDELQIAARERAGLKPSDRYKACEVDERKLEAILASFKSFPQIKRAYIVCKDVSTLSDRPFYVLVVEVKFPWYLLVSADEKAKTIKALSNNIALPSEGYIIEMSWAPRNLKNALKELPETLIYEL